MTDILVFGAGMVGICSAIELQSRGHSVSVVDKKAPGTQTSYGNAGIIQAEAAEPYAMPRDWRTLIRMALGRSNDVSVSYASLIKNSPALIDYFSHSSARRHASISRLYSQLIVQATTDHNVLINASNANHLISKEGFCEVYRDPRQLHNQAGELQRLQREYGIESRLLSESEYKHEEPAIKGSLAGAIHWPQSWACSDPGGLTQHYAALFEQRGGHVFEGDAADLQYGRKQWTVKCAHGNTVSAESVVMALGPWTPVVLKKFGYRIPMILKRGYHQHMHATQSLNRPLVDVSNGIVAASMVDGLRVTSGAALVNLDAPAKPTQLSRGISTLRDLLDIGSAVDKPIWFGTRPCMPNMLPVVGRAPGHRDMWFNFGHGHQGFTLGPTTAKCLGLAMDGQGGELLAGLAPGNRTSHAAPGRHGHTGGRAARRTHESL